MARLFQLLLGVNSATWKRQVAPYMQYPWKIVAILDEDVSMEKRLSMLSDFFSAGDCMLDAGASRLARGYFQDFARSDLPRLLEKGHPFYQYVVLLACNKTNNIQCEDNFARASSARQCMRGNAHASSTMASKHVSGEVLHIHKQEALLSHTLEKRPLPEMEQRAPRTSLADCLALTLENSPSALCAELSNAADDSDDPRQGRESQRAARQSKVNSWVLFKQLHLQSRPALLGESKQQRLKRVVAEAPGPWTSLTLIFIFFMSCHVTCVMSCHVMSLSHWCSVVPRSAAQVQGFQNAGKPRCGCCVAGLCQAEKQIEQDGRARQPCPARLCKGPGAAALWCLEAV